MTNPQQPEMHRSGYGNTTQDAKEMRARQDDQQAPREQEQGPAAPSANVTTDQRHAGTRATSRDALQG